MTALHEIIGNLIFRHNCVILPDFGGFIANTASAKIDWKRNIILPPHKTVSFNRNLNTNDGLVAQNYSELNNVSFDEAKKVVADTVVTWVEELKKGNRIEIEKVGLLFFDQENNICFEQDRFFNLLMSSFGLENVQFISEEKAEKASTPLVVLNPTKEVEEKPAEAKTEADPVNEKLVTPIYNLDEVALPEVTFKDSDKGNSQPAIPEKKSKRKYWKYAAAAILLPIGFYSLWIPMKTKVLQSGIVASQDFNPFTSQPQAEYSKVANEDSNFEKVEYQADWETLIKDLPQEVKIFSYKFDEDFYIPVRLEKEIVETTFVENKVTEIAAPATKTANVHVIAGCFGEKENADSFVADMNAQGYSAFILDKHKGLHRVSVIQAQSKSEASEKRAELTAAGLSSWILSK